MRFHGYLISVDGGPVKEADTLQCPHCNCHFVSFQGSGEKRSYCRKCMATTCGREACVRECLPHEERLERIEKQSAMAARG